MFWISFFIPLSGEPMCNKCKMMERNVLRFEITISSLWRTPVFNDFHSTAIKILIFTHESICGFKHKWRHDVKSWEKARYFFLSITNHSYAHELQVIATPPWLSLSRKRLPQLLYDRVFSSLEAGDTMYRTTAAWKIALAQLRRVAGDQPWGYLSALNNSSPHSPKGCKDFSWIALGSSWIWSTTCRWCDHLWAVFGSILFLAWHSFPLSAW